MRTKQKQETHLILTGFSLSITLISIGAHPAEFKKEGEYLKNLIKNAKSGDQESFIKLLEQNKHSLIRVGKSILGNDEDVADALQETALLSYKNINSLKKNKYFKTWLTRIMIFTSYAILRKNDRLVLDEQLENTWSDSHAELADTTFDVQSTLGEMKVNERLILTLYYLEDLSSKEIAGLLSISENAVFLRLSRSRKSFKKIYLEKEESINEA